jgi:hypothetical protein
VAKTARPTPADQVGAQDGTKSADGERPPARLRWPHWLTIAALSAAVSILGTGSGLVWAIHPAWKPDPGEKQLGQVKVVAVETAVASGHFGKRVGRKLDDTDACFPGNVYFVQQNLQGFKDRSTSLVYIAYDGHGHQLRGAFKEVGGHGRAPSLPTKHSRTDDQEVVVKWLQWPWRTGTFFIRFEVWRNHSLLALVDSPKFKVSQKKYSAFFNNCLNG